jgi:hypothetical protein
VRWQSDEGPPRPIYTVDLRHEYTAMSDHVVELVHELGGLGQFIEIKDVLQEDVGG